MTKSPALSYHIGTVSAVNDADCTTRVQVDELGVESYWLQVLQNFAGANTMYSMPTVGDRVACLLDSDGSRGLILGGVYDEKNRPSSTGQDLLAMAIPQTTIDGNVKITGNVEIAGNVTTNGDTSTSGAVTVQGSHSINGKDTMVVGGKDTRNDTMGTSGQ